jgi:hypothetical protein
MTEWYHLGPSYNGPEQGVTYSEKITQIASATLGIAEWNYTTSTPVPVFSYVTNDGDPTDFSAQPNQLQQFTLNGFMLSADAYEFVTGS